MVSAASDFAVDWPQNAYDCLTLFRVWLGGPCLHARFTLFYWDTIGIRKGIVTDAGYLPRNLQSRLSACDLEAIISYFLRNVDGNRAADAA